MQNLNIPILKSADEMTAAILANNPIAVRHRMAKHGFPSISSAMGYEDFVRLLKNKVFQSRQEALNFVTDILNVELNPNGRFAPDLIALQRRSGGHTLGNAVYQAYDQIMPYDQSTTSVVEEIIPKKGREYFKELTTTQKYVVGGLAAIGALFLLVLIITTFAKITKKIIA